LDNSQYYIHYEDFNGPAGLLLELVRKKKIDLYQVKLNSIILDFLIFVEKNKNTILLETLSSFVYIASILLEIKSRSVIPSQQKMLHGGR
jgi:segregation and condensation protein A